MLDPTSKQDPVVPDVKGSANGEYGAWLAGSRKEDVGDKSGGCSSFHIDQNATNHIVLTFFLLSSVIPHVMSRCVVMMNVSLIDVLSWHRRESNLRVLTRPTPPPH